MFYRMMTLDQFEQASEKVQNVILPTNLIYSEYYSAQTGGKIYLKPENMQYTGAYKFVVPTIKSVPCQKRTDKKDSLPLLPETMHRALLMQRNCLG